METGANQPFPHSMAFYHQDGLPAAWGQAMEFAGKGGRIATMPDIVAARLETKPGEMPWETYFTTLTAEYFGFSRRGALILVVAHGIGPMSTLDGIKKAYSWEFKDKSRNRRGGRITEQEFWDLAEGKFGEVHVVDITSYFQRYEYPFISTLRLSQLLTDPVFRARLGPLAEEYVQAHAAYARTWHLEQAGSDPENRYGTDGVTWEKFLDRRHKQHMRDGAEGSDPYIVTVSSASNCWYCDPSDPRMKDRRPVEEGYAIAHLVSTGALCNLHHEGNESLVLDVGCHEWWNGVRLVGIQAGGSIKSGLHSGPDAYRLLRKHWRELLVPMKQPEPVGFRGLVSIGEQWFTQYPKVGDGLDTWEPEYVVTSKRRVGKPVLFRTEVLGYYGFFKFSLKGLQAMAPPQANAYHFVDEPQLEAGGNHQTCTVQFYRIMVDASQRMIRSDSLAHDYQTMMKLLAQEATATN